MLFTSIIDAITIFITMTILIITTTIITIITILLLLFLFMIMLKRNHYIHHTSHEYPMKIHKVPIDVLWNPQRRLDDHDAGEVQRQLNRGMWRFQRSQVFVNGGEGESCGRPHGEFTMLCENMWEYIWNN